VRVVSHTRDGSQTGKYKELWDSLGRAIPMTPKTIKPGSPPGFWFFALSSRAYWTTTWKVMLKEGVVAPVLPAMVPVVVNFTWVTVGSWQGRVQLGKAP